MVIKSFFSLCVAVATLAFVPGQDDLTGIKCVVEGDRAAVANKAVAYKDGKVYLCCDHCADAFKKDATLAKEAKFSVKANHQLVLTGQYVQKGCPFSDDAIDENLTSTVAGIEIGFSCPDCQSKIDGLKTVEEKVALLFSEAAFSKAFALKQPEVDLTGLKCMMMPEKAVSAEQAVEFSSAVKNVPKTSPRTLKHTQSKRIASSSRLVSSNKRLVRSRVAALTMSKSPKSTA